MKVFVLLLVWLVAAAGFLSYAFTHMDPLKFSDLFVFILGLAGLLLTFVGLVLAFAGRTR